MSVEAESNNAGGTPGFHRGGGGERDGSCSVLLYTHTHTHNMRSVFNVGCGSLTFTILSLFLLVVQMAVLKKHHRAAHHGHYYECLVKFKGVAYNKVRMYAARRASKSLRSWFKNSRSCLVSSGWAIHRPHILSLRRCLCRFLDSLL